jgi:hypothetical protein
MLHRLRGACHHNGLHRHSQCCAAARQRPPCSCDSRYPQLITGLLFADPGACPLVLAFLSAVNCTALRSPSHDSTYSKLVGSQYSTITVTGKWRHVARSANNANGIVAAPSLKSSFSALKPHANHLKAHTHKLHPGIIPSLPANHQHTGYVK